MARLLIPLEAVSLDGQLWHLPQAPHNPVALEADPRLAGTLLVRPAMMTACHMFIGEAESRRVRAVADIPHAAICSHCLGGMQAVENSRMRFSWQNVSDVRPEAYYAEQSTDFD